MSNKPSFREQAKFWFGLLAAFAGVYVATCLIVWPFTDFTYASQVAGVVEVACATLLSLIILLVSIFDRPVTAWIDRVEARQQARADKSAAAREAKTRAMKGYAPDQVRTNLRRSNKR